MHADVRTLGNDLAWLIEKIEKADDGISTENDDDGILAEKADDDGIDDDGIDDDGIDDDGILAEKADDDGILPDCIAMASLDNLEWPDVQGEMEELLV